MEFKASIKNCPGYDFRDKFEEITKTFGYRLKGGSNEESSRTENDG